MTTTIPSTRNAAQPSGAKAAAPKGAKPTIAQTAHVSVDQGNNRRTVQERHHGDSAWSSALHAAIGQQPNGMSAPDPAITRTMAKAVTKKTAGASKVQAGSKRVVTALDQRTGKILNGPESPRDISAHKSVAPHAIPFTEAADTRDGTRVATSVPARNNQSQPKGGHSPEETNHQSPLTAARLPDIKTARTSETQTQQHAATTEAGHSESAQSLIRPSGLHPPIARNPGEQPTVSMRNSSGLQGQRRVSKQASISNPQDGPTIPTIASIHQIEIASSGGAQAAPVGPSSHSSAPASSQMLNPGSLQHLSAQIHLLHQAGGGQAEIRLDPPSLGSVQIQLTLQQNQAQVSFHAAQTATAQMLQANLPQLTQAMQQQGLTLTHTQVHALSDGTGVGPNTGNPGQQPGQQSGQQPSENSRATISFDGSGNASVVSDSESGVRAYA